MATVHPEFANQSSVNKAPLGEGSKTDCGNVCFACFCPCLVLNAIPRTQNSEESVPQCIEHSVCCVICWPLSPLLGWKVVQDHKRLRNVQLAPHLVNSKRDECTCSDCWMLLRWPWLLADYSRQISLKYSMTNPSPETSHMRNGNLCKDLGSALAIVGPDKCGKTSLLVKLVGTCLDPTQQGAENNEEIHLGFKPLRVTDSAVEMLDVWDLPASKLPMIRCIPKRLSCIVLCFDAADEDSFNTMSDMFDALRENFPHQYVVCAALKTDIADGLVMNMAEIWARRNRIPFAELSCSSNTGVNELLKLATQHLGPESTVQSAEDFR